MNYKKYIVGFFAGATSLVTLIFVVNVVFDPLWFFTGNKVGQYNYAFNERLSKLNLLNKATANCLVMGSSYATFIKADSISSANCFNIAFSGGYIEEYMQYIDYYRRTKKNKMTTLIIGVGSRDFFDHSASANTKPLETPSVLASYLSIDSFWFSMRLWQEKNKLPRIYNKQFNVEVVNNPPTFNPSVRFDWKTNGEFQPNKILLYKQLIQKSGATRVLLYVPPLSAWYIKDLETSGRLTDYLFALYQLTQLGYTLIDYSIISPLTLNPNNTYDGHHFFPWVSDLIVQDINDLFNHQLQVSDEFGLHVNPLTFEQYQQVYASRIAVFGSDFSVEEVNKR